jgi:DNA-binding transcriptional MerR regulator
MAFTIKELEALSGIKAHTIRIWEQRYRFLKPARTQTNIRTYSNDELKTLLTVALLNKYGYKISRIDGMHPDQRVDAILGLTQQPARDEHLVNQLLGFMVDMKNIEFEELLNRHIQANGIESTIAEVIFYFLEKVGILWQTNRIIPVQEHIVSAIIRQKLVAAIEGLPFVRKEQPLTVLYLPEDEHHEIGLLFVYYLMRKQGIPVIYLGANVPLKDIGYLLNAKKPAHIYLHLTSLPRHYNFQRYLTNLSETAKDSAIVLSGGALQAYRKPLPPNITFLQSFREVISYISSL